MAFGSVRGDSPRAWSTAASTSAGFAWFAQHARHAGGAGELRGIAVVVFGCQENDRRLRRARLDSQAADQLVTVHRRHHEVGDDERGILAASQLQGLLAVAGFDDGVAARAQHSAEQPSHGGIVIRYQHRCHTLSREALDDNEGSDFVTCGLPQMRCSNRTECDFPAPGDLRAASLKSAPGGPDFRLSRRVSGLPR